MRRFSNQYFLWVLGIALAAGPATTSPAQDQPAPPPAPASTLPADVAPGSPLADVIKMVQAGVEVATIQSYIVNCQSLFNLDADKILFLKDEGVPSDLINAMLDRDKALAAGAAAPTPPPSAPAPAPAPVPATLPVPTAPDMPPAPDTSDVAPPPADITVNYFYNNLSSYGSWVSVDGYGQCWRPTVVLYDAGWRPYCDRGHWVYTDYGWYWDSDYAWGVAFHYGRWFHHARFGWCWYPDTVWAPSWVSWRSGGDYCGWAPLPPFAVYTPGVGFYYRGAAVSVGFDFGLSADAFVFVTPEHFCDRHPRSFCVDQRYAPQIYHQTTIINNYNVSSKTIVNRGFGPDRIASVTHHEITPVRLSALPNATRQGWRGDSFERTSHSSGGFNNHTINNNNNNSGHTFTPGNAGGNNQLHRETEQVNRVNNPASFKRTDNNLNNTAHTTGSGQQNTSHTDAFHSPEQGQAGGAGHGSSATINNNVQQPQNQNRYNGFTTGNHVTTGNAQNEGQNYRFNNASGGSASGQQHGGEQLQPRSFSSTPEPRQNFETAGRNFGQAGGGGSQGQGQGHVSGNNGGGGSQGQAQAHATGNGGAAQNNASANNANNANNANKNKQNQ